MERGRVIQFSFIIIFVQFFFSCKDFSILKSQKNTFEGTWSTTIKSENLSIHSLFIQRESENIFDCYFISSSGHEIAYKAIYEDEMLKIGNEYTIKYLEDSKQLYIVEYSIPLKPTKNIEEALREFRKSLFEEGANNVLNFMYFPFEDEYAKILGVRGDSNYSMYSRGGNINNKKIERIFSQEIIACLLSADTDVITYKAIQDDQLLDEVRNHIRPYEYYIECSNNERSFLFLFSLRNGEYKLSKLLYQP